MTRTITAEKTEDDLLEATLRPRALDDYVGQEKAKGNLGLFIDAARGRG
jgi:holliday junction DNA helicase RuvB